MRVKIGARKDGTLSALDVQVVSNTGAYGNHGSETLAAAMIIKECKPLLERLDGAVAALLKGAGVAEDKIELKKPEQAQADGPAHLARRVEVMLN